MPAEKYRELQDNVLMFYTGDRRNARQILNDQARNMVNQRERSNLIRMTELARQLRDSLVNGNPDDMGMILDENWHLKKNLSKKISQGVIDHYYEAAKKNGALGGKLLGAGGRGFVLFYCRKEDQEKLRRGLSGLREMTFAMDHLGTRLILNSAGNG